MNLFELTKQVQVNAVDAVPDWMLGAFRRRSISFSDGTTDLDSRVFWLQSRGLTIDLRLPTLTDQQALSAADFSAPVTLQSLAQLEGWYAHSLWQGEQLSWGKGANYQFHNCWPESAELRRVGNCMVEFAPSGAYVEDWRLMNATGSGPLIGLELESETDLETGVTLARRGALIINGDYAGLVLGRSQTGLETEWAARGVVLTEALRKATSIERSGLLDFQVSVATGSLQSGYRVEHSLQLSRVGELLLPFSGFSQQRHGRVTQRLQHFGREVEWCWRIDCLEKEYPYCQETALPSQQARHWRKQESPRLDRYTRRVVD